MTESAVEILPSKDRAKERVIFALIICAVVLYFALRAILPLPLGELMEDPGAITRDQFAGPAVGLVILLIVAAILIRALRSAFRKNPTPRIRITKERLDFIALNETSGFSWADFGTFKVMVTASQRGSILVLLALSPNDVAPSATAVREGIRWSSLAEIDITPFAASYLNVEDAERMATWMQAVRDDPDANPPEFLRTRKITLPAGGGTVVRR